MEEVKEKKKVSPFKKMLRRINPKKKKRMKKKIQEEERRREEEERARVLAVRNENVTQQPSESRAQGSLESKSENVRSVEVVGDAAATEPNLATNKGVDVEGKAGAPGKENDVARTRSLGLAVACSAGICCAVIESIPLIVSSTISILQN
ncbi:hypothetical protein HOP50_04g32780 [Chloropicon primus]|uniref:Uncharacterized protein n=1 Tax=Chloropicon primus TaxID=1764295 RepID=A0A5B8MJV9_9CHLO|nr:hypothetical protein A3770_04p32740 [Chloropicon primus]UPQ99968.1 hypothetical protein HOP50_04g32780 [Chloropicon primus]|eukprot:QDZ20756.1 hypothetical protein A3770_04p32740 [Chloropicon primus]